LPQTFLTIYRTGGDPIIVSAIAGGFACNTPLPGDVSGVFRVDFFSLPTDGTAPQFIAIVPCDPAQSTIHLDDSIVEFKNLNFTYVLGTPNTGAQKPGLAGQLRADPNGHLFFEAPLTLDGQTVLPGSVAGTPSSYSNTFRVLMDPNGVSNAVDQPTLPNASVGWENFTLGNRLYHHIRALDAGRPGGNRLPILTMERDIPAVIDATGIRRLPPPFSILVNHPSNPNFATSSLRAVQSPLNREFVDGSGPATAWVLQIGDFNRGTIADFWQHYVFERYVGALESVESGEPVSLLPRFLATNSVDPPTAADGNWLLRLPAAATPAVKVPSGPGWLMLAGPGDTSVRMSCDAFRAWDGNGIHVDATLVGSGSDTNTEFNRLQGLLYPRPYMEFSALPVAEAATPGPIRVGSLDLIPSAPPVFQVCAVGFDSISLSDFCIPRIRQLSGDILLSDAQPGGQDDPADPVAAVAAQAVAATVGLADPAEFLAAFRRQEALVIPLASSSAQQFDLLWAEKSVAGFNQSLTLSLTVKSPGNTSCDLLVIDQQPFSVARIQLPGLASAASSVTNEVAQWSNTFPEGPGWRIAAGAGKFQMLLPPQGVGEEMVKTLTDPVDPAANFNRPMRFRLTPTSIVGLQSDTQLQRYAEPGWNLRRVLGYPGQRAPGAALQNLSFEMLYGMTCNVTAQGLRMSEMFSRLGAFTGPLLDTTTGQLTLTSPNGDYSNDQKTQFSKLNLDWAQLHAQLLSRLGVLELWAEETDHELTLTNGVSYRLRNTAQLKYPAGTQKANSNAPQEPADGGLPGGVGWPFDSANIYESLWSNPDSIAAVLSNPRFTALGGSGKQRGIFSNGNIIIESETSLGALESLTVILRGYIGNLRHHAKLVTIYQRSVRPSRQFYHEQPLLEGRPILRKTVQYVELTQKQRSYPEIGDPNPATGPLLGAEFKSIRINVDDSAWGSELGKGRMTPLWKGGATPADVYPRPQVLLELAIDPAKGTASRNCEMQDPEKLCFYTDTNQTSQNTDDWPMVEFVDFCNNIRSRSIDTTDPTNPIRDHTREPGFGQFTYTVDGDAPEVNVVAQRTKNAMSSRLTNVMFMRGQPQPRNIPAGDGQAASSRVPDHVQNILDELVVAAQKGVAAGQTAKQALTTGLSNLGDIVNSYSADIGAVQKLGCDNLAAAAGSLIGQAANTVSAEWNGANAALNAAFQNFVNPQPKYPEVLKQTLLTQVDTFYTKLQSAVSPLITDLSLVAGLSTSATNFSNSVAADLLTLKGDVTDAKLALDQYRARCTAIVQRCQSDINVALGDIKQLLDALSFLFVSVSLSVSIQVEAVRTAVDAFSVSITAGFASLTNELVNGAAADVDSAIDSVRAILPPAAVTTALGGLNAALGAVGNPNAFYASLAALRSQLRAAIINVADTATADLYQKAVSSSIAQIHFPDIASHISSVQAAIVQQVRGLCTLVMGSLQQSAAKLADLLTNTLAATLNDLLPGTGLDAAIGALEDLRTQFAAPVDDLVQQCRGLLPPDGLATATDSAVAVIRAFGAPPLVPNLGFNLPALGYFFDGSQAVAVSKGLAAAATEASTAINGLSQLGLNLPTTALLDRLVPDLSNLNISDLLPNIAGLNLETLFSGVGIPASASDNIHVSHKLDPQTLRASLDITLNFTLAQEATLFSIGPATVSIDSCNFDALVHVEGGPGEAASRTSQGAITGDWYVEIGGLNIVTFVSTALSFDAAGHLHFDISPDRVQLNGALAFLADFLQSVGLDGDGFSINLLPTGVQCTLDLPFPDISAGAFGITNLCLGAMFGLQIGDGLDITVGANLGRETAPFTLTIFILGGAGWFEASLTYHTQTGQLTADVSIGILASAGLSISLGPISGGVYIYFGITTEFHSGSTGSGLTVGILLMIEGRVSLLGIIDVDIMLLLEAEYTNGGGLTGRGQISMSIKICWCFTLNVSAGVQYTFGSAPASAPRAVQPAAAAELAGPPPPPPGPADTALPYAQAAANRVNFLT